GQADPRAAAIDLVDLHFADNIGRPIRKQVALAILGLEQSDRIVGQIELDIGLSEKILAEEKAGIATEILLASDHDPPALANGLADLEPFDICSLEVGFATNTESPITLQPPSLKPQP